MESELFLSVQQTPSNYIFQKIILIIEMTFFLFNNIYYKYKKEMIYFNTFLNEKTIKQENKKIGQLLSILVPEFVKESLIQGIQHLSEDQGNVTILFCDICNFDNIIINQGTAIINILDELFRQFDNLCLENHVQKIEVFLYKYFKTCLKNVV